MKFNLEEKMRLINAHTALHYTKNTWTEPKDFYNAFTGELTCGRCDKRMSAFRALLHWHWLVGVLQTKERSMKKVECPECKNEMREVCVIDEEDYDYGSPSTSLYQCDTCKRIEVR